MLVGAIKNELEKMYSKKRLHVIVGIIFFFAAIMVTISYFEKDDIEMTDIGWEMSIQEQIEGINSHLDTANDLSLSEYNSLINQENKLEYHLENNINPEAVGATGSLTTSVTGAFIKVILPVLVVIITADLVVGESANGTLKSLLVSPLGRKKILVAKCIAALIVAIGAMTLSNLLTYFTSIPFYGFGSWNDLIVIGTDKLKGIPIWAYMIYGLILNILTIITLISIFILVSVLFNTVATAISLSISFVIFGGLLANFQGQLDGLKYIFIVNIDLASHLTGEFGLQNTSFLLSLIVMLGTMFLALILAFSAFTRKDMLI